MSGPLEREIKLRFESSADARQALLAMGATPLRSRRLQSDILLDTPDSRLRDSRCALRVRIEPEAAFVTFKGPPQPSSMKLREEIETLVGEGTAVLAILGRLGYQVCFRYEKYREEFAAGDVTIALDETPVGTYVEIEGSAAGIHRTAVALGRGPADFVLSSYRTLFVQHCAERGIEPTAMVFEGR